MSPVQRQRCAPLARTIPTRVLHKLPVASLALLVRLVPIPEPSPLPSPVLKAMCALPELATPALIRAVREPTWMPRMGLTKAIAFNVELGSLVGGQLHLKPLVDRMSIHPLPVHRVIIAQQARELPPNIPVLLVHTPQVLL
jgi:hypothetical protein